MRKRTTFTFLAVGLALLAPSAATAYPSLAGDWQAYYPDACPELDAMATECVLCHQNGTDLNLYGQDLSDYGSDFALVGLLDSDFDGRTNDEEILVDCTLPGDAASPNEGATWGGVKALFD